MSLREEFQAVAINIQDMMFSSIKACDYQKLGKVCSAYKEKELSDKLENMGMGINSVSDKHPKAAIVVAVETSDVTATQMLLAVGANVNYVENQPDGSKKDLLAIAIQNKDTDIIEVLLKNKCHVDSSHLLSAINKGYTKFLSMDYNKYSVSNMGLVWQELVDTKNYEVAELLNDAGINETHNRTTPLVMAVQNEDQRMVELLLRKKASPNLDPVSSNTNPLITSVQNTSTEIAKMLLASGADPFFSIKQDNSAFRETCKVGNIALSKIFIATIKHDLSMLKKCEEIANLEKGSLKIPRLIAEASDRQHFSQPLKKLKALGF